MADRVKPAWPIACIVYKCRRDAPSKDHCYCPYHEMMSKKLEATNGPWLTV